MSQKHWKLKKCFNIAEASFHGAEISESQLLSSLTVVASACNASAPTATTSNASTCRLKSFCVKI